MIARRLIVLLLAGVAAAAGIFVLSGAGPSEQEDGGDYRVDVVFDNARGLIGGQLVEIAGGRVGEIEKVTVTKDFKARIAMAVDSRFAPFREDATCTIKPQGLIAENYVQCNPGSPDAPELLGAGGEAPTVPVEQTSQPVNLTDVFELWNVPTRDRLAVLLSELGISSAARGEDLNAVLRRANPALERAQRVIGILEDQRNDLLRAVDATDEAVAGLVGHREGARRLVRSAAAVLTRTARHADDLAVATQRLPGMLRAAEPALERLGAVARSGIPLLAQVHRAAPTIAQLTIDAPALAKAARPTLAKLAPVLDLGSRVVKRALPLSEALSVYAEQALPNARLAGTLLTDLSEHAFPENFMKFIYYSAVATARFDDVSHILPSHIDLSQCGQYATTPVEGCSANYGEPATPASRSTKRLLDYLLK